jgi:hypothetical protein
MSVLFGLIGVIVTPIVVFFAVLIAAHLLDPRCGTPGDSGGCEMGAAVIAFASAGPGLAIGVALALWRHYRKQRAAKLPAES